MRAVTMIDLRFDSCRGDQTDADFALCFAAEDASTAHSKELSLSSEVNSTDRSSGQ